MEKPTDCKAAAFAWMIPQITQVARVYGYAIGLHGSMARDLDLIAVPWIDGAAPAETLVEAIREAVDGHIRNDPQTEANQYYGDTRNPNDKPHGRRAWSIYFSGRRFYIDLSVMPRSPSPLRDIAPSIQPVDPKSFAEYAEAMQDATKQIVGDVQAREAMAQEARSRVPGPPSPPRPKVREVS